MPRKYIPNDYVYRGPKPAEKAKHGNRERYLFFGIGCNKWDNCFTCPDENAFKCHFNNTLPKTPIWIHTDGLEFVI